MDDSTASERNSGRKHRHLAHVPPLTDTPLVFFTVTTHDRRHVLGSNEVHGSLAGIWRRSAELDGWFVGDYLLMPDHVHLFARAARERKPMATWVQMWKSISARELKKAIGLEAPVWQEDYFDRYLRSGESYSEKWAYVELNPVRAGLVTRPGDWPYRGRIHELRF